MSDATKPDLIDDTCDRAKFADQVLHEVGLQLLPVDNLSASSGSFLNPQWSKSIRDNFWKGYSAVIKPVVVDGLARGVSIPEIKAAVVTGFRHAAWIMAEGV